MKGLFIALFLFGMTKAAFAQNKEIAIGEIRALKSNFLNETRKVAIYTPQGYEGNEEKYPVLYVLDAEWHFPFVASLVDKLSALGDIPKMIVIGIYNTKRNRDLTPPEANSNPEIYGGGQKFLNFIVGELQPWIDGNYRTQSYRILAGHSFGGLFAVYAMMEQPEKFESFVVLSPSLGRNSEKQVRVAESFFDENGKRPESLYLSIGNEGGYTYSSTRKFSKIILNNSTEKLRFKFEHLKEETHESITTQGLLNGLKFIFEDFNPERLTELDEIFLVEEHYKSLSKRYGYTIEMPEYYFQKFVKEQIGERELDYALFILEKYKVKYPNSTQLLMFYADTYLLMGDFNMAQSYYKKFKKLGIQDDSLNKLTKELNKR